MSPEELEHARCLMESHEALKKQTGRALLAHIDMQTGQIGALRAALQTAIAYEITCRLFRMPLNHCSIEQKQAALSDARHHIEEYMEEGAQLAREIRGLVGMNEKYCKKCNQTKPLSEFYFRKTGLKTGTPLSHCKACCLKSNAAWQSKNPRYASEYNHKTGKRTPLEDAPECAAYLGEMAERALSRFFDNITRMPMNNPGYDFICGKGFKIDVKAACTQYPLNKSPVWRFNIRKNSTADYFLCLAFDNRDNLNPVHVWLIPGKDINQKTIHGITNKQQCIEKWSQYERPINKVLTCCNEMRIKLPAIFGEDEQCDPET